MTGYMLQWQFCIPAILTAYVLIKVKSSQDILQGINKLDYLLKVSVFQKYKDPEAEKTKTDMLS